MNQIANVDDRTIPKCFYGVALGGKNNPNLTYFRKQPKVRGKANVKAAKRARIAARTSKALAVAA